MTSEETREIDEKVLLRVHGEGHQNGRENGFLTDKSIVDKSYREQPRAIISSDTFRRLQKIADDVNGAVFEPDRNDGRIVKYLVHNGVLLASYSDKCRGSRDGEERWWEYPVGYARGLRAYKGDENRSEYIGEVYRDKFRPIPRVGEEYEDTWPRLCAVVLKGDDLCSQIPVVEVLRDKLCRPKEDLTQRIKDDLGLEAVVEKRMETRQSLETNEGKKILIFHHYYLCRVNDGCDPTKNGYDWINLATPNTRIDPYLQAAVLWSRAKQITANLSILL